MRYEDRVYVSTATAGNGSSIALGSAVSKYRSFSAAGFADGDIVEYVLEDGSDWETAVGTVGGSVTTLSRTTKKSSNANSPLSLSGNARLFVIPHAVFFNNVPRGDLVQSLSSSVKSQVRANISAAPFAAMAANNMAINGFVDVSQELGTTGLTLVNDVSAYSVDMIKAQYKHAATTAVVTSAQVALTSGLALAGFDFGQQIKATTAITSPANGDYALHQVRIEGYRVAKLGWGAAGASDLAYAFRFYSTVSGVAMLQISNSAGDRVYHRELTVAAGWNFFSGIIPGDTTGTWLKTNGVGLFVQVITCGKEASPATPDAWGTSRKLQTTNSTNLLGTNNNLTILTGLYLGAGPDLPTQDMLPLLRRPFAEELALCERYFFKSHNYSVAPGTVFTQGDVTTGNWLQNHPTADCRISIPMRRMRATPTVTTYDAAGTAGRVTYYNGGSFVNNASVSQAQGETSFLIQHGTASSTITQFAYKADARL